MCLICRYDRHSTLHPSSDPLHYTTLVADALTIRGIEAIEIIDATESRPHRLTAFAVVEGEGITYPAGDTTLC